MQGVSLTDQIMNAMTAHAQWKQRLLTAIKTQSFDSSVDFVEADNNCAFGKWLHFEIEPAVKSTNYLDIKETHRRFHVAAAGVLRLALGGKSAEALAAMDKGSDYAEVTDALQKQMVKWLASSRSN